MPEPESEPSPLSRVDLLRLAQSLGVSDADVMTRAELRTAIEKARLPEPPPMEHPSTWVGVARRLLARVVERGLNLPDAAALIRGDAKLSTPPKAPPPVATVTLARIYAAQGHLDRAIGTLEQVLESDPDHELARDLLAQLELRRDEIRREALRARREAKSVPDSEDAASRSEPPSVLPPVSPRETSGGRQHSGVHELRPSDSMVPGSGVEATDGEPLSIPDAPDSEVVTPRTNPPVESVTASSRTAAPEAGASETDELVAPAFGAGASEAGELVAPAFGTAARSNGVATRTPRGDFYAEPPTQVGPRTHDWETPISPSVEPLSQRGADIAADMAAGMGTSAVTEPAATELSGSDTAPPESEVLESVVPESVVPELALVEALAAEALTQSLAAEVLAAQPAPDEASVAETLVPPPGATVTAAHEGSLSNGIANGAALGESAPRAPVPEPPLPDSPGLILIETDSPLRYLYWELGNRATAAPHWITIVTHAPAANGLSERRERQFPVQQKRGAVRLEGLPHGAIIRAKLSPERTGNRPPLVVAASVQSAAVGTAFQIRYVPHAKQHPEAIAQRARPLLERAVPVYWDD